MRFFLIIGLGFLPIIPISGQSPGGKTYLVSEGWSSNSVNTVVFRKNSLVTYKDTQFVAFYDKDSHVVLGKRGIGSANWELKKTVYKGNVTDAHNSISIMIDGHGYLHLAWDHHVNPLNYCKSISPGALELTGKLQMTGINEKNITYPEFYRLTNGDLIFLYRNGASGKGDLVLNKYELNTSRWTQLHANLIDGEGKRNAYWQACIDNRGVIHISWVWRESPDVASNHDMCYARSVDGGITWEKSNGEHYILPIKAVAAEYACRISQNSELINQTSMATDKKGNPYIATYWRENGDSVPQYHLIFYDGKNWKVNNTHFRSTPFSLSGSGTKRIPIARPQIILWSAFGKKNAGIIFRDAAMKNRAVIAVCKNLKMNYWSLKELLDEDLGSWEPTYDTELWKDKKTLNLFIQNVIQADAEGITNNEPQMIKILEWKYKK